MIVPACAYFPKEKFRFLLTEDFKITLPRTFSKELLFFNKDYHLATLTYSRLVIYKGFKWDGCSPSKLLGFPALSIPSPVETLAASLCHDLYYQFLNVNGCPWNRKFADEQFKYLLNINGFKYTKLYFFAVDNFGGYFTRPNTNLYIK